MALQWSSVQPTEPGYYWAAWAESEDVDLVELAVVDGKLVIVGNSEWPETLDAVALWAWPVEVPPAPVRPQKEKKDVPVSKSAKA